MKIGIRRFALATALAVGVTAVPFAAFASTTPAQEEHHDGDRMGQEHRDYTHNEHPEWNNNTYYRTGNREGYQDYRRHTQRAETAHHHNYRSDEDRSAHDYGYQQGWSGTRWNAHDGDRR